MEAEGKRLRTCEACKKEVPAGCAFCPACGNSVESQPIALLPDLEPRTKVGDRSFSWKTVGRVASIVALMGFTMPWVSCAGNVSNGIEVANRNEFVWFFPISVIAALVMLFTKPTSIQQMKKIYKYVAGCGLASTVIIVVFFLQLVWQLIQMDPEMREFVGIHYGMDFSMLGSFVLLLAGVKAYRSVSVPAPEDDSAFHASASHLPK